MPLILPGNVASATAGGFEVANSCRFASGDSAYMHKTLGTATNEKKFTFSAWIKRGLFTGDQTIFNVGPDSSDEWQTGIRIRAPSDYDIHCTFDDRGTATQLITTPIYRDPSAWMHVVFAVDTTQSTEANRMKLYVNGVQMNDTHTYVNVYPSLNTDCDAMDSGNTIAVGRRTSSTNMYFDGYMAEVYFIDGTQYAASDFGEYSEDSPTIWMPKDASALTFGNNGFYLDFEDSSNLGNDANGGTDLTEVNLAAADQSLDSPTNNFCTLNSINPRHANLTMSEGNCALASSNAQWLGTSSTIAVSAGKWYAEWKYIAGHNMKFGIVGNAGADISWLTANQSYGGYSAIGYEYQFNNSGTGYRINNDAGGSWSNGSFTAADSIIMMAFDIDAGKIWWGRNGTWFNNTGTANPATGTDASTTGISSDNAPYIISCALEGSGSTGFVNFGGCSGFAISSGNSDGTYGNFEYSVPSGFKALCTKNLAEYG